MNELTSFALNGKRGRFHTPAITLFPSIIFDERSASLQHPPWTLVSFSVYVNLPLYDFFISRKRLIVDDGWLRNFQAYSPLWIPQGSSENPRLTPNQQKHPTSALERFPTNLHLGIKCSAMYYNVQMFAPNLCGLL